MPADVSELEQLAAQFRKSTTPIRRAVRGTVQETTEKIKNDAFNLAPEASGDLRESIDSEVYGPPSRPSGRVSASEYYGMFPEFGTAFQAPQPFMTPALEQNEDGFYTDTESAVLDAVNRALGG